MIYKKYDRISRLVTATYIADVGQSCDCEVLLQTQFRTLDYKPFNHIIKAVLNGQGYAKSERGQQAGQKSGPPMRVMASMVTFIDCLHTV